MRLYTVQSAANLLGVKPKQFFRFLREHGYLSKHNLPQSLFIQKSLFVIKHTEWIRPNSDKKQISSRTLLTQKGLGYFDEALRKQAPHIQRTRDNCAANEGQTREKQA